jgi:hypothetical protein
MPWRVKCDKLYQHLQHIDIVGLENDVPASIVETCMESNLKHCLWPRQQSRFICESAEDDDSNIPLMTSQCLKKH